MTKRTVEVQTEPFECVPHWLLFQVDISANALRVYLILRKHRDYETSECHPSRKRLATMAGGIAVSTLDRALGELVSVGAISIEKRYRDEEDGGGQTSNRYLVHWDKGGAPVTHEQPPSSPVNSPPTQNWDTNEDLDYQDPLNEDPRNEVDTEKPDPFDEFWKAYPRKKDKGHARKTWEKASKTTDPAVMIHGAVQFRQWCEQDGTDPQFIPHASTWLNGERWNDERDAPTPTKMDGHIALIRELWDNENGSQTLQLEG